MPAVSEAGSALLFAAGENGSTQPFALGGLVSTLPAGDYALADGFPDPEFAVLGFALSSYRFEKYRKNGAARARLVVPATVDVARVDAILKGVQIARDLINIPANDMGPQELAAEIRWLFVENGGTGEIIEGDALLDRGFPMVHAVGRASSREPRLADFYLGPGRRAKSHAGWQGCQSSIPAVSTSSRQAPCS